MQPASAMRHLLADTASALGPDAPTLCDPWTVRDLVAHEVLRESRPDAAAGIALPGPFRRRTEAVQARIAEKDFAELVRRLRQGPPRWSPTRVPALDRSVNLAEFAVHLEDLVRAQPGWEATSHDAGTMSALWNVYRGAARLAYRSAPVGVVAVAAEHGRAAVRRPRPGSGTVVLRGTPLELLLHAFGRTEVARVRVEGSDADVEALAAHERVF
jgi:uncharacterized protein (TIGR03085 family)